MLNELIYTADNVSVLQSTQHKTYNDDYDRQSHISPAYIHTLLAVSELVMFNVPLDTLQVISETVLQAITCTGRANRN